MDRAGLIGRLHCLREFIFGKSASYHEKSAESAGKSRLKLSPSCPNDGGAFRANNVQSYRVIQHFRIIKNLMRGSADCNTIGGLTGAILFHGEVRMLGKVK
jgi:hypothetical protein